MLLLVALISAHLVAGGVYYPPWEEEFSYYSFIDSHDAYALYWNVFNDSHLEIGLEVRTSGWIGFGLSANGQMPNADIIIGWVDPTDGQAHLENRFVNVAQLAFLDVSLTSHKGSRALSGRLRN